MIIVGLAKSVSVGLAGVALGFLSICGAMASDFGVAQVQVRSDQDRYLPQRELRVGGDATSRSFVLFGVFDGHGKWADSSGQSMAPENYAVHRFPDELQAKLSLSATNLERKIQAAFVQIDSEIARNRNLDDAGTTASLVLVDPGTDSLYVANVGDSPVILVKADGTVLTSSESARSPETEGVASAIHNASVIDERVRMASAGIANVGDHFRVRRDGLLSVSRTLGDCAGKRSLVSGIYSRVDQLQVQLTEFMKGSVGGSPFSLGLSPLPSIFKYKLSDVKIAIITSDGVIDPFGSALRPADVAAMAYGLWRESKPAQEAAQFILEKAVTLNNDDKTVEVLFF